MNILYWGDSPLSTTGYGRVAGRLLKALTGDGHEIDVVGLSAEPGIARAPRGMNIYHVQDNYHLGIKNLLASLDAKYDAIFTIHDPIAIAILDAYVREYSIKLPRVVSYFANDWYPGKGSAEAVSRICGKIICASEFSKTAMQTQLAMVGSSAPVFLIPHGVDRTIFSPGNNDQSAQFRKEVFKGISPDVFAFCSIAVNSVKKNLGVLLQAYATFKSRFDGSSILYMHCNPVDAGGDLTICLEHLGLKIGVDVLFPKDSHLSSQQEIRNILVASDAAVFSTYSEGWCLPVTEAFACRVPVVAPHHTAIAEHLALGNRGYTFPCDERVWIPSFNHFRPYVPADSLARAMLRCADEDSESKLDSAEQYAQLHSWEVAEEAFVKVFRDAK